MAMVPSGPTGIPWRARSSYVARLSTLPSLSSYSSSRSALKASASCLSCNCSHKATASSIFVTPWKCAELGIRKQRMPWEWRHSLKCWSKARRPQYDASPQISHLNS